MTPNKNSIGVSSLCIRQVRMETRPKHLSRTSSTCTNNKNEINISKNIFHISYLLISLSFSILDYVTATVFPI